MSQNPNNFDRTERLPVVDEYGYPVEEEPRRKKRPSSPKKSPKKNGFIEFFQNITEEQWNIVLVAAAVIVDLILCIELFYLTQFASIKTDLFITINLIGLVIILLINGLVYASIHFRNNIMKIISAVLLATLLIAGGIAGSLLTRVNNSIEEITSNEKTEDVSTSFVVYNKRSGDILMDINDLDGLKVGIVPDTSNAEMGMKKLSDEGISVEYVEFTSYGNAFTALLEESIDCAIMPKSYALVVGADESLEPYITDTTAILSFTETVTRKTETAGADKDLTKEPFTVLLSGENEGLADTIILVSINPVSMKVTMTSIARDSYVPIACYGGGMDKINASHVSSEDCLIATVENLTGIEVDYYVEFNFRAVVEIVNALDGLIVTNEKEFMGQSWNLTTDQLEVVYVPEGENIFMHGMQILALARERYAFADGDFARQRHQQMIIEAVIDKIMATRDPNVFVNVFEAAGKDVRTNMSVDQMLKFVNYIMLKSSRYYNPGNLAGVLNINQNTITGYNSQLWNDNLDMYLYIFRLWNGAITDTRNYVSRNLSTTMIPDVPVTVEWNGASTYTPPAICADAYAEQMLGPVGGPPEDEENKDSESASPSPSGDATASPAAGGETQPADSGTPETPTDQGEGGQTPEDTSGGEQSAEPAPAEGGGEGEAPAEGGGQ